MSKLRRIEPAAVLSLADYARERAERRRRITELKANRRLEVGPFATFYFESYDTMLHQVHEMLFIEKGGAPQLADELSAYNPLIPQGAELVATVMLEIEEPVRRARILATLGGIEHEMFMKVGEGLIRGIAEGDQERTRDDGKASSVQFVRFPFAPPAVAAFRNPSADVVVGFSHPNYRHMAAIPPPVLAALAEDFD